MGGGTLPPALSALPLPAAWEVYDALAELLTYPGADYPARVAAARAALARADREAAALHDGFAARVAGMSVAALQELFTQTFDLNPPCALEVGWHLFGEEYERGAFLVRMREELRRLGLPESTELPDHLTHVLVILGRWPGERGDDFATACVLPAVDRMLTALTGKDQPYEAVLRAIRVVLAHRHGEPLAGTPGGVRRTGFERRVAAVPVLRRASRRRPPNSEPRTLAWAGEEEP